MLLSKVFSLLLIPSFDCRLFTICSAYFDNLFVPLSHDLFILLSHNFLFNS